jgi:hypothetical protein
MLVLGPPPPQEEMTRLAAIVRMINIFFIGVSFKNRYRYCNIIQTIAGID